MFAKSSEGSTKPVQKQHGLIINILCHVFNKELTNKNNLRKQEHMYQNLSMQWISQD
jgi:hypothetical protein